MEWVRATNFVMLGAVTALLLYNVLAGVMGGGEATISARMQHLATRYPVIPLAVGMLVAHWFWPVFGVRD